MGDIVRPQRVPKRFDVFLRRSAQVWCIESVNLLQGEHPQYSTIIQNKTLPVASPKRWINRFENEKIIVDISGTESSTRYSAKIPQMLHRKCPPRQCQRSHYLEQNAGMFRDLMDSNGLMQWVNMGMDQVMRIPMLNHKFWSCLGPTQSFWEPFWHMIQESQSVTTRFDICGHLYIYVNILPSIYIYIYNQPCVCLYIYIHVQHTHTCVISQKCSAQNLQPFIPVFNPFPAQHQTTSAPKTLFSSKP